MSLEMWLFLGVITCGLLVWYLYQRSQQNTDGNRNDQMDDADTVDPDDDYEDLLLTGLMLNEVYDDDDADAEMDTDGYDSMDDSGGFDDSGFE